MLGTPFLGGIIYVAVSDSLSFAWVGWLTLGLSHAHQ